MDALAPFMPILATVVGTMLSIISGFILAKLNGIKEEMHQAEARIVLRMQEVETKMFNHIVQPGIHGEAVAKLTEQITNLLQTVRIAHERIDRFKDKA